MWSEYNKEGLKKLDLLDKNLEQMQTPNKLWLSPAPQQIACSRLRDGGGKSFTKSYFRFARFNTFPLYYLRAWHRLPNRSLDSHS